MLLFLLSSEIIFGFSKIRKGTHESNATGKIASLIFLSLDIRVLPIFVSTSTERIRNTFDCVRRDRADCVTAIRGNCEEEEFNSLAIFTFAKLLWTHGTPDGGKSLNNVISHEQQIVKRVIFN